jgi:carbamoylphosphate synthase large subunit
VILRTAGAVSDVNVLLIFDPAEAAAQVIEFVARLSRRRLLRRLLKVRHFSIACIMRLAVVVAVTNDVKVRVFMLVFATEREL